MSVTRRSLAALPLAAIAPRRASAAPVPDYERPLFHFEGQHKTPVKIASLEILRAGSTHLIRSRSADGATGYVVTKSNFKDSIPLFLTAIAPHFVGQDARRIETLLDSLYLKHYKLPGQTFWIAVASAELSILDLLGRTVNKPLAAMCSAKPLSEIPIYLSGSVRTTTAEEEVDCYERGLAATGAQAVKFKIGGRMSRNADAYPGRTERLLELARKRYGDKITIHADANGSYDAAKAIEVGKTLQSLRYGFFEEPCPWEDYEDTRRVTEALDIPVAAGEQDSSLPMFRRIIANHTIDIVQPDVNYSGGFIRASRVARMAREAGMRIVNHNTELGPALAKLAHFAAATPNFGPNLEYVYDEKRKEPEWYSPRFEVRRGRFAVPQGPGLGIEYDPAFLEKAVVVKS
jgi:L-alanine-DL-glutamate epimerase-like enolase superfamily enzyme